MVNSFKRIPTDEAYLEMQKKKQDKEVDKLREQYKLELEQRQDRRAKDLERRISRTKIYDKLVELGFFSKY